MRLIKELRPELCPWEEASRRTDLGCEVRVEPHRVGGDAKFLLESLHQPDQVAYLTIGKRLRIAVSDQADADGVLIVLVARFPDHVGTRKLIDPSVADMDLSVAQTIPVSHQEVIAESLIPPREVTAVDGLGCSEGLAQMVDHDSGPTSSSEVCFGVEQQIRIGVRAIFKRRDGHEREPASLPRRVEREQGHGGGHGQRECREDVLRSAARAT